MAIYNHDILAVINRCYEEWLGPEKLACEQGCDTCCTQNVMITAAEGEVIHAYINKAGKQAWLAKLLSGQRRNEPAVISLNGYARACLEREEVAKQKANLDPCPFLEQGSCTIYPVRPFACRCFGSTKRCQPGGQATLPDHVVSGSIAIQQVVEHLGHKEYWGRLCDVLLALCEQKENKQTAEQLEEPDEINNGRARLIPATPLPGFMVPEEDQDKVWELVHGIFDQEIGGKRIGDIFNGH